MKNSLHLKEEEVDLVEVKLRRHLISDVMQINDQNPEVEQREAEEEEVV